jgi:Zn-dependent protease with chaperone function
MRVNGLYGHVRSNDARSLALFGAFLLAFHVMAMVSLLVPLAMFDPEHSPLYGWSGYLTRWVPLVTLAGGALFAVQMIWHVRFVRTKTAFRFVDGSDEPRLCRIIEPLAIAAGLPSPYVGVIESPAMNAFACGIRRQDAVLVFTRGLIDGLDDDELAAVAAHELTHVVNGDIRLIAAANVCLNSLLLLQAHPGKPVNRVQQAVALPIAAVTLPILFVLIVIVWLLRRLALEGARLTRLMIASSREFIADAEAVRLTHNPAALVSALRRIDGRSRLAGIGAGQDAMMIDGEHTGAMATHPTVAERIRAIIAVTGSMALNAPARRDTRTFRAVEQPRSNFGRKAAAAGARVERSEAPQPTRAVRSGLSREMAIGAMAAVLAFVFVRGPELRTPEAVAATLDPRPLRAMFAIAGAGFECQAKGTVALAGVGRLPTDCGEAEVEAALGEHRGQNTSMGRLADALPRNLFGTFSMSGDGEAPAHDAAAARVERERCFITETYSVGDRGLRKVDTTADPHEDISVVRYLRTLETSALRVGAAAPSELDAELVAYVDQRGLLTQVIHRFFGEPGLRAAGEALASPAHQRAVALLGERLSAVEFTRGRSAVSVAEMRLLAASPTEFVPCVARENRVQASPAG